MPSLTLPLIRSFSCTFSTNKGVRFPRILLSATLGYALSCIFSATRVDFPNVVYWDVSGFQTSMLNAIQKDSISEYHFLAVYLILRGSRVEHERDDFEVFHKQDFLTIFRRLEETNIKAGSSTGQGSAKLTFLGYYSLSALRHWDIHSRSTSRKRVWELPDAAKELRLPEILPGNRFRNRQVFSSFLGRKYQHL